MSTDSSWETSSSGSDLLPTIDEQEEFDEFSDSDVSSKSDKSIHERLAEALLANKSLNNELQRQEIHGYLKIIRDDLQDARKKMWVQGRMIALNKKLDPKLSGFSTATLKRLEYILEYTEKKYEMLGLEIHEYVNELCTKNYANGEDEWQVAVEQWEEVVNVWKDLMTEFKAADVKWNDGKGNLRDAANE
ncbi:Protein of unknown function [Pyronema omphalodes CBS 100304]|uniref:Uncharacterized protein n=1 Tax=Pyronema omphalodes (strain CBS 100304) TaxID=1076935 RepID=U4LJT0_PYROM|nr:Protein of unknown function [Pyronema omphalodes CBS 100304]